MGVGSHCQCALSASRGHPIPFAEPQCGSPKPYTRSSQEFDVHRHCDRTPMRAPRAHAVRRLPSSYFTPTPPCSLPSARSRSCVPCRQGGTHPDGLSSCEFGPVHPTLNHYALFFQIFGLMLYGISIPEIKHDCVPSHNHEELARSLGVAARCPGDATA